MFGFGLESLRTASSISSTAGSIDYKLHWRKSIVSLRRSVFCADVRTVI